MQFFIYSRKSVYTGKGESIENQIEMCKQYIHSKFSDVSDADITVYEDEGFSAKNTDRPQFQQMLRDIKLKKPDFVVCYPWLLGRFVQYLCKGALRRCHGAVHEQAKERQLNQQCLSLIHISSATKRPMMMCRPPAVSWAQIWLLGKTHV